MDDADAALEKFFEEEETLGRRKVFIHNLGGVFEKNTNNIK